MAAARIVPARNELEQGQAHRPGTGVALGSVLHTDQPYGRVPRASPLLPNPASHISPATRLRIHHLPLGGGHHQFRSELEGTPTRNRMNSPESPCNSLSQHTRRVNIYRLATHRTRWARHLSLSRAPKLTAYGRTIPNALACPHAIAIRGKPQSSRHHCDPEQGRLACT